MRSFFLEENIPKEYFRDVYFESSIALIDEWHSKWHSLLDTLLKTGANLQVTLSGGKDSRVALTIIMSPPLDYDNIDIYTNEANTHTFSEDRKIASAIASRLDQKINKKLFWKNVKNIFDLDNFRLSFFMLVGFYWIYRMLREAYTEPLFKLTGYGGESHRHYWYHKRDQFFRLAAFPPAAGLPLEHRINPYFKKLESQFGRYESGKVDHCQIFWEKGMGLMYFGRMNALEFNVNCVGLAPLMDPVLLQVGQPKIFRENVVFCFALILCRYGGKIADIEFDSGHTLGDERVLQLAKELSNRYPVKYIPRTITLKKGEQAESDIKPPDDYYPYATVDNDRIFAHEDELGGIFGEEYRQQVRSWNPPPGKLKLLNRKLAQIVYIFKKIGYNLD